MPTQTLPETPRTVKMQYTEVEAAEELGITVTELRTMIRHHVVEQEEDVRNVPQTTFQPSDLLVLRLLGGSKFSPNALSSNPSDPKSPD